MKFVLKLMAVVAVVCSLTCAAVVLIDKAYEKFGTRYIND